MVLKCPNCGQQLRGEPGASGTCPKCKAKLTFPEGDPNHGEPIVCPHCGQTQRYNGARCISCGKSLSEEKSELPKGASKKKGIIFALISWVVAWSIVGVFILSESGWKWFLTEDQKSENITDTYFSEGYDAALRLVVEYYGTDSTKALAWAAILMDTESQKVVDDLEVVDQSLVLDGNYFDYETQIKNNSDQTITYIKVNIYLFDENGEIVNTDWTNWSGTLPPGGSTYLDTMIKNTGDVDKFKTEIEEASID